MRTDRLNKAYGGLITLIRDNITLITTDIPLTINTHNTELQMVKVHIVCIKYGDKVKLNEHVVMNGNIIEWADNVKTYWQLC